MDKITFCIPSKSNLRYLKTCIPSIRKNASRGDHDIIVFVDEDTDGTVEWLKQVKDQYNLQYYVNPKLGEKLYGIGKAYDYCVDKSTTDVFMIFHADMMLGLQADKKAFDNLERKTVVCSTRVEPPIHPNAGEKILKDFGMYPEEYREDEFDEFVESQLNNDKSTEGIFAPWMMYKDEFQAIGGHDARMHSCREDSDVFNRLLLDGFTFKQPWNSLVYHLTGRGAGSFDGDKARHEAWKRDMNNSTREFFRKWKSVVRHTSLMKPIVSPIYNIGIQVSNANEQVLAVLEPWCDNINVDCDYANYIEQEQYNTVVNFYDKIDNLDRKLENDVVITIDAKQFTQQDYLYLQSMGDIIADSGQIGKSKLGNLFIEINKLEQQQDKLIKV